MMFVLRIPQNDRSRDETSGTSS